MASFDRATMRGRLGDEQFDLLVIGGGITGVGTALDAASRGLRTALVERDDFASGTSSKSSKLIHGGLRYLQQGDVRLVYEALAERQRLRRNAPHLVRILPFMIPILTRDGVMNPKIARAFGSALWMYDLTGGARIGKLHRRLKKETALRHMPTMPADRLASAYLYYDARADDARLCLTVARTAAAHGAVVLNGATVVGFHKDGERIDGARVAVDGQELDVRARVVVNAAGVWSDEVRALDEGVHPDSIRPAKGVHLTIPWEKVQNDIAVVIPVPKDKRSLFVVPWGDHTYVGTTDTDYHGPIDDPQCTREDMAYVLRALNHSVTTGVTEADVTGTWAGLRPLVKRAGSVRTADLSRLHRVAPSESGLISVTGGKLTTYRRMAADTVDRAMDRLDRRGRSKTKRLRLLGAEGYEEPAGDDRRAHLLRRYGTLEGDVEALIAQDASLGEPLVPGLPYVAAEAVYAARHEMARSVDDVLSRRTRARLLDRAATAAAAEVVARLLAPELGWSDAEIEQEAAAYRRLVEHEAAATRDASDQALDAAFGA
jgi:glycerol-3-phosphate dehydrogenase